MSKHQDTLAVWRQDTTTVLAAIASDDGVRIFQSRSSPKGGLAPKSKADLIARDGVAGAEVVHIAGQSGDSVDLLLGDTQVQVPVVASRVADFAGKRCMFGMRNYETVADVAFWMDYHHRRHDAQAAVILDRANDPAFAEKVGQAAKTAGLDHVVVLHIEAPLGSPDLPSEAHPFCCPTAPGKDRMEALVPDPARAPLAEQQIFELVRHLYLRDAAGVLSLDVSDLVPRIGPNIFEQAAAAANGFVSLQGSMTFPWRVRNDQDCQFADHICHQFDTDKVVRRWCLIPHALPQGPWRYVRAGGLDPAQEPHHPFWRFMGLRHPGVPVAKIVPKSSLVPDADVRAAMSIESDHKPVPMPQKSLPKVDRTAISTAIVTTMKNEGPFILEWLAYHRVIGVDRFLVYTNDCNDGTDTLLDLLQDKGFVQHRDNPFKGTDLKPQHAALQAAEEEPTIADADWAICMDVDEYINIKVGDGTLRDLYAAVGDANMISCTWRLFGNADVHLFEDTPIIGQFDRCAPEYIRKPHQAWGFKTLFRNVGIFKKLGVHRPKGLNPQLWEEIRWVNGSGKPMPKTDFRNAWRSTAETYGYDLVSLNHYAVRSAESFLVKRDRGRVNHVDRDQGLAYWFRMNNNSEEETTIQRMIPAVQAEMAKLLSDPDIAREHGACVQAHRAKIDELKATERFSKFYADLCSERLERLSRMHHHFGANVFLVGPDCVPDKIVFDGLEDGQFFTVDEAETQH